MKTLGPETTSKMKIAVSRTCRARTRKIHPGSRNRCPQSAGFTLIEVLIVVVIVAMLFGAVAVSYSQLPKMQLREAGRKFAGGVRFLSGRARTSRTLLRLVMDLDKESPVLKVERFPPGLALPHRDPRVDEEEEETLEWRYENWTRMDLSNPVGPLGAADPGKPFLPPLSQWESLETQMKTEIVLENVRIASVTFPCMNKEFTSGLVSLAFYPNGTNWGAVILLRSTAEHELSVIVEPMTGHVRYESGFVVPGDLCEDAEGNLLPPEDDDEED